MPIEKDSISPEEMAERGYEPETISTSRLREEGWRSAQDLVREIQAAFTDIPRPMVTLSVARGYDDEWELSGKRICELSSQDPEQHWQEVTDTGIEGTQEYFTFSDAEGWLFYLPAFLCHYLRNFPDPGWEAVYRACTDSTRMAEVSLSRKQAICIDRFLALCDRYESR